MAVFMLYLESCIYSALFGVDVFRGRDVENYLGGRGANPFAKRIGSLENSNEVEGIQGARAPKSFFGGQTPKSPDHGDYPPPAPPFRPPPPHSSI